MKNNKRYWAIFSESLPTSISEIDGSEVKISELIPLGKIKNRGRGHFTIIKEVPSLF